MFPTSAILGTYWAMIMIYNFVFLTFSLRIFHLKKPNAEGQLVRNIPWPCISLTISTRSKAPVHAPTEMAVACISCLVVDWFIDPCCRGVEIKVCLVRLISWVDVIVGDWKFGDPRIPVIWCPCVFHECLSETLHTYVNDISAMHYFRCRNMGKYMCHFGLGQ